LPRAARQRQKAQAARRVNKKAKKARGSHRHPIPGAQWEADNLYYLPPLLLHTHTLTQGAVYKTLQFKIVMLHDESSRSRSRDFKGKECAF